MVMKEMMSEGRSRGRSLRIATAVVVADEAKVVGQKRCAEGGDTAMEGRTCCWHLVLKAN